jgi:hypothetical protein
MVPVTPAAISETMVETGNSTPVEPTVGGGDMAVKSAAMKPTAMKSAAVPSASMRVGEIWLAENGRAQQRSCYAHHSPCLLRGGFVIP